MTGPASKTANIKDENADPKSTEDIYSGTQEDAEMEERYWKQFVSSGSVEDYLCYKSCHREEEKEAYCKNKDRKLSTERETFT